MKPEQKAAMEANARVLKSWRTARLNLRQTDMARALEISPRTLRRWESGDEPIPRYAFLAVWCMASGAGLPPGFPAELAQRPKRKPRIFRGMD